MLRGPAQCSQGPGSPLPALVQVRGLWLSSPQDPTWLQELALGAKMLPLSQPETMSGQQNNLPHTGAQSSQSPNVWAHWLLCRQPGPEQPAFSAHTVPLPTLPQWGSLCSWGYWDWPPNPGLWLLKRQRQRDEVRSTRKKRNLKADSQGVLWTLFRAWRQEGIPAQLCHGLAVEPGQVPAPLCSSVSSCIT